MAFINAEAHTYTVQDKVWDGKWRIIFLIFRKQRESIGTICVS